MSLNESIVEDATLEWFGELGYAVGHRPQVTPSVCIRLLVGPFPFRRVHSLEVAVEITGQPGE